MKILLVSGFLGAGKTSFIKAMVKATGREFVILENEFAEADVDGATLKREAPGMKVWELSEGCICCSLNLDFTYSVLTIENTLHPDYLIVEPSGVARPSHVLENLAKLNYDKISLLAPVTIVDGQFYRRHRLDFPDYFNDQVLTAGTVVLSKSEDLSVAEFQSVRKDLQTAADVSFPNRHYSRWSKTDWQRLLHTSFTGRDLKAIGRRFETIEVRPEADEDLANFTVYKPRFENPISLYAFLSALLEGVYGQVIRVKGLVFTAAGEWLHVELAGDRFSITGLAEHPDEDGLAEHSNEAEPHRAALVIIGKHLQTKALAGFAAN